MPPYTRQHTVHMCLDDEVIDADSLTLFTQICHFQERLFFIVYFIYSDARPMRTL